MKNAYLIIGLIVASLATPAMAQANDTASLAINASTIAAASTLQSQIKKPKRVRRVVEPVTQRIKVDNQVFRASCNKADVQNAVKFSGFKSNMPVMSNRSTASKIRIAAIQSSCTPQRLSQS